MACGHDAWKVGGKMFACIGAGVPGVPVKTDRIETAGMLIDAGVGARAPYFHRSRVNCREAHPGMSFATGWRIRSKLVLDRDYSRRHP